MKILIMGLPGSGKTWLGEKLGKHFGIPYWDEMMLDEYIMIGSSHREGENSKHCVCVNSQR